MTTSGSYDFDLDRDAILKEAYQLSGATAIGEDPTSNELAAGGRMLNLMLRGWLNDGAVLWLQKEVTVLPAYQTAAYNLGPSGGNASASVTKTEIATAASETDTDIVVDSITGVTDGDYIGIELDDKTVQWTTVNGTPSGSTISLDAALTDDVAVDNHVYVYTTKIQRPLEIVEGRRIAADGTTSTPLIPVSRREYMELASKSTSGIVTQFYYDPQLVNGALYVWPTPSDVQEIMKFTVKYPFQDFDASTDTGDFPPEWLDAVVSNLALRICIKNKIPVDPDLREWAMTSYFMAKTASSEMLSVYFEPEMRGD